MNQSIKRRILRGLVLFIALFLFLMGLKFGSDKCRPAAAAVRGKQRVRVVIDPGHGGEDPGKVGRNGAKEKEINLAIALKLKGYLEANDCEVFLTRQGDTVENVQKSGSKKVSDLNRRIQIMEEVRPALAVSIHQNSYPQEKVHGAQMFYYKGSEAGRKLALTMQDSLRQRLDAENRRAAKENTDYYLLKNSPVTCVIAECGFLSNEAECTALSEQEYQDRIAWSLAMGVLRYLAEK